MAKFGGGWTVAWGSGQGRGMKRTRVDRTERLTLSKRDGGDTLCLFVRPGNRSRPWIWFEPHEVPAFEGKSAKFKIVREDKRWKW